MQTVGEAAQRRLGPAGRLLSGVLAPVGALHRQDPRAVSKVLQAVHAHRGAPAQAPGNEPRVAHRRGQAAPVVGQHREDVRDQVRHPPVAQDPDLAQEGDFLHQEGEQADHAGGRQRPPRVWRPRPLRSRPCMRSPDEALESVWRRGKGGQKGGPAQINRNFFTIGTLDKKDKMATPPATYAGLLLLFSYASAQIRGDNIAVHSDSSMTCHKNDGFGKYCPTMCGVSDYMQRYASAADDGLDALQRELDTITNLTRRAEESVIYMKDSLQTVNKNVQSDISFTRSSSMLDEIIRFERTIIEQEKQIFELDDAVASNERRMADLKMLSIQLQKTCDEPCKDSVVIEPTTGTDCQDIANKGATVNGLYYVKPAQASQQFLVYCEIDSFGRGFTVLQRRQDGSLDFHKDWIQYKEGFGYLSPDDSTEFWLGNEKIHQLSISSNIPMVLRVELTDWDGNKRHADYAMFRVGPEADMYRLTYGYYAGGDAGDAFDGFDFGDDPSDKYFTSHNGMQFSTFDKDNDKYDGNCAMQDGSGWWMNRCHAAHLNGKYYTGGRYTEKDAGEFGFDNGVIWVTWHNRWYSLKETTMKIIPITRLTAGGGQQGVKQFGGLV
ncbi:fibrinogen gamma chain isoform X2 [Stigmatopora argus]